MTFNSDPWDHTIVNNTLKKVAKSGLIISVGSLIGSLIFFFTRIIIVRVWTIQDYGIFSLSFALPSIIIAVTSLGIKQGMIRNIAYARQKKDEEKISKLISTSTSVFVFLGVIACIFIFIFADFFAIELFHEPGLIIPIKIFSLLIPLARISGIISAIFIANNNVKPNILFNELAKYACFLALVLIVVFLGFSFRTVYYSFLIAAIISTIIISAYGFKKLKLKEKLKIRYISKSILIKLLIFSMPLYLSGIIDILKVRIDIIMLGNIENVVSVALYNAAIPLSQLISFPLGALAVIYMPVVTGLYAKNKNSEIKRNYIILTKWLMFISIPIFIVLIFFPSEVLRFVYGAEYVISSTALRIGSIQGLILNIFGLNKYNLISFGKTKMILISSGITLFLNFFLNILLIPIYSINGAIGATLVSMFISNIVLSYYLYHYFRVQPFSKNLIKTAFVLSFPILIIYYFSYSFFKTDILLIILFYIICNIIVFISIIVTKSVDKEDIDMIESIENKTGLKLGFIKKLFLRAL